MGGPRTVPSLFRSFKLGFVERTLITGVSSTKASEETTKKHPKCTRPEGSMWAGDCRCVWCSGYFDRSK